MCIRDSYEGDETQVLFGQFAGCVEQDTGVRTQRPVMMLAATVDTLEGLFVQQEPDASSFPNGGIRNTFEARGYSAWDPSCLLYTSKTWNGSSAKE